MIPLAATSANAIVRRLGSKRWLAMHRLVYVIAPLGVLHFLWMVKADITEPAIYAVILATLLGSRVIFKRRTTGVDWQGFAMRLSVQQTPKHHPADIER